MNIVLTVMEIVAPVFLLAAVGFAWVRLGFEYRVQFVTRLAMTLGVPCLVFTALMKTEIDPAALTTLSLAAVVAYAGVTVLCLLVVLIGRLNRRTYLAPIIFGNTGNMGLPLALFAFGEEGLGYAVVVFAVMAIYSFTIGVWLVSGGGSPLKVVKEPLVGATLLGGVFLWQGWQTPVFLTNTLELIGQMAIPLMLITLGVAIARLHPSHLALSFVLSLVKVVICIATAWGVGLWFQLDPVPFAVLVLQVSTPVAVTSYLLAEKYGADAEAVAGLVVVSTLISVVSLPLALAFLI
ncbi:putative permease [Rhodovulum iodosum]|uniref:Permease n=1 Tax=Rhodovulum iodosum TaxID=68291 RepID=A0ABV3XS19_9RHOB|nr:AEC family transporter [Rhodovulum robiginosum]RSK30445.1 AEC family transporter [Rhodovulum robiginosum]